MAEGGPLQEYSNDDTSIQFCRLLDCPICLEQMHQPKSLPCLHSYCEECLGTYIVTDLSGDMAAATSFPCPVCRKITSPVDPSESKETWARQFPTNNLVQKFATLTKKTDTSSYCGPCKRKKNMLTPAKFFCRTNVMMFCEVCKENVHDLAHEDCDIVSITDENYEVLQNKPVHTCSTHNEKIDWYCEDHKFIGCSACIITEHRQCDTVKTVTEYLEKQQQSSHLDDVENALGQAFNNMILIKKSFDDKDDAMQQCQENDLKSISDLRQNFISYLDQKQDELTQDLTSKYKAEKAKVDISRQKCSRLMAAIQNTKDASRTAAQTVDHIEMIQLFHRGQTEIAAYNDLIVNISSSKSVTIKHDIDTNLATIDQSSPLSLGRILVEEQPCSLPDGVDRISNHTTLSNNRVTKVKTLNITVPTDKTYCTAHGVVLMENRNIVISDHQNDCLKLFSSEGKCLDVLNIGGWPHDLCLMNNRKVAVAVSNIKVGIHVVNVHQSTLTLSNVIKTPHGCYGISFIDGKFMVSTPKDIYRVGMDGKTAKVHSFSNSCHHLVCCPVRNLTYASILTSKDAIVTKLSSSGQTCVMEVGVVDGGMGIDVDNDGNLYVCGQKSKNVVQISACGTRIRELLTVKDGIDKPRAISVRGDRLVVTNESSADRNNVNVYQLC
ncbi:LOW QUALITY PROTEIN: uncharacterized protein [Argopecten irradians]|uniref:LOW QUALITY PROTEIN: uncharacterized protein n=1 Tax=Argopecten irradians TaxID=31199 RepID=UPI00371CC86F